MHPLLKPFLKVSVSIGVLVWTTGQNTSRSKRFQTKTHSGGGWGEDVNDPPLACYNLFIRKRLDSLPRLHNVTFTSNLTVKRNRVILLNP